MWNLYLDYLLGQVIYIMVGSVWVCGGIVLVIVVGGECSLFLEFVRNNIRLCRLGLVGVEL